MRESRAVLTENRADPLLELLRASPIFGHLPLEQLRWLAKRFRIQEYSGQEPIIFQGDPSEGYYLVVSGKVKIVKESTTGQAVLLELILPGEVFGALAVFDGKPYPATAQPIGRAKVARLGRKDLTELLERHPEITSKTIMPVMARVRKAHEMRMRMATQRVERRIIETLLDLAPRIGEKVGGSTRIPVTRRDIAELVGTTVETSIRVLSRLKAQGLVDSQRGWVIVNDLEALREAANEWE
jgi:CRP-like cAMP-binding protein